MSAAVPGTAGTNAVPRNVESATSTQSGKPGSVASPGTTSAAAAVSRGLRGRPRQHAAPPRSRADVRQADPQDQPDGLGPCHEQDDPDQGARRGTSRPTAV